MKTFIKVLSICLLSVLLFSACTKKADTSVPANQTDISTEEPTQTPEPTPSLTFEEIVSVQPNYFVDGGGAFQIKSSEANYYGEITVGQRSYVDGASSDLQGTYALFVSDSYGGSASIDIEFADSGYTYKNQFYGIQDGDAVKYPYDTNDIYSSLLDCHYNRNQSLVINNLTYLYIDWRKSKAVFSEKAFNMLAVVISKDEAVRFVQDGTLPNALQGLTVTGLEKIFKKPNGDAMAQENISDPGTTVSVTEILPPNYSYISVLSPDLLAVKFEAGDKYGIINKNGDVIAQQIYDIIRPFSDGMAVVRTDPSSGEGYIDETGNMIVQFGRYHENRSFSEGLAAVKSDAGWGFIDPTGKEIVPCKYDQVGNFSDGMAPVKLNEQWSFIDKTGKVLNQLSLKHDNYNISYLDFHDGMANVVLGSGDSFLGGYIDTEGNEVIPCTHEGWSFEAVNGQWGIFSDGVTTIEDSTGYFVIDKSGKEVVPRGKYSYIGPFFDERAVVMKTDADSGLDQFSIIDTKGSEIVTLGKYEQIKDFSDGMATVYSNGKNGLIDANGNEILPLTDNYQGTSSPVYGLVPFSKDTYTYGLYEIKLK